MPLVAAGGLTTGAGVREALRLADAVQLGTAFLDADESGTPPAHRRALRDPAGMPIEPSPPGSGDGQGRGRLTKSESVA